MKVLVTWSDRGPNAPAKHPVQRGTDDTGPVLRLLTHTPDDDPYDVACVLCTAAAQAPTQQLAEAMRAHVARVQIEVVDLGAPADPSDYERLFRALEPIVASINGRYPASPHRRDLLLSAGTPQAQTCWVLLNRAGLFDARMLQVIPPHFVPDPHPRPVKTVQLDFDGFPEIKALRERAERLERRYEPSGKSMVGASPQMNQLQRKIARLAPTDVPVLIVGETGVGKERVARALHRQSQRRHGPYVAENCSAFAEGLLASELFGSERGAFTGSTGRRRGLFERAHGGTLFLDEIGEMDARVQAMLLRVLQEGSLRRVGGESEIHVDVRIIAATHRSLAELIEAGRFRQDLYYRLEGAELTIPALREREGDVPVLVEHFMRQFGVEGKLRVSAAAMNALCAFSWPGNVRELESEVRRWTVFSRRRIDLADLSPKIVQRPLAGVVQATASASSEIGALAQVVEAAERGAIESALAAKSGNLLQTAKALQIDRNTLKRKLARWGLREG